MRCFAALVASVAQLVEQLTLNQLVHGSSPCRGTISLFPKQSWHPKPVGVKSVAPSLANIATQTNMSKPPIAPRHILVVDDEPYVCDAVRMMLAFDGHQVETAASGKEALALFNKVKFDLVITDYAMPGMKGDELAASIKVISPAQPVVLITAYAEMLKSAETPLTGVDFIVSKPFLLENLREAIEKTTPRKLSPPPN